MLRRVWCVVAIASAGFATLACGNGSREAEDDVATVVTQIQQDFEVGDVKGVCRATTADVHRQLAAAGHGTPAPCPVALNRVLLLIEEGLISSGPPRVDDVMVDGNEAVAVLVRSNGVATSIPLERKGDRWRMSNFFGVEALPEAKPGSPAIFRTGPADVPRPSGAPLAVSRSDRTCPALTGTPVPARSGCTVRVVGRQQFQVSTVLGSFSLGNCDFGGVMQVAADGSAALHGMTISGDSPCNDVQACAVRGFERAPWEGRLRKGSDDRLNGRLDVCLDTCVGRFVGPVALSVERGTAGWQMSFDQAPVGSGSLTLSGTPRLRGMGSLELLALEQRHNP